METTEMTLQAQIWGALTMVSIADSTDRIPRKHLDYSLPSTAPNDARRVLKLVEAVALIAANRPTWQSVSAAAFELQRDHLSEVPELVIRIAQNGHLNDNALESLNSILSLVTAFVQGTEGAKWRALSKRGEAQIEAQNAIVREFVYHSLLENITMYNDVKITGLISNRVRPFRDCWSKIQTLSPATALKFEDQMAGIIAAFQRLATTAGALARGVCLATIVIRSVTILYRDDLQELEDAWRLVIKDWPAGPTSASPAGDIDDSQNTNEGEEDRDDDDDDVMTLDGERPTPRSKCLIIRVLIKLARYCNAGTSIVRGLLRLSRNVKASLSIRILGVESESNSQTAASALSDGVVKDGGDGFLRKLHVSLLHEQSKQSLNGRWDKLALTSLLYVHAELKLAIFYLAHPERLPLYGILGISKKTCLSCNEYLKLLQKSDNSRYDTALIGQPLLFFYSGSHQRAYNSWRLPDLPPGNTLSPEEQDTVGRRMQHVGEDVARGLGDMARQLVEYHFGHRDTDSESSGHSEGEIDAPDKELYAAASLQKLLVKLNELQPE
ncbi:hypothetical protein K440DRAFT_663946 [Wilcoxina mikolae CBS 423.85]|nr:hypothetical protein K440DRAFT_663946 [Wilcoxina mikolae CBS 423.85]